ncbi:MAG TPA: hypothetical protein VGC69_01800 [Bordetella sp.]
MQYRIDSKTENSLYFLEIVEEKSARITRHVLSVEITKSSQIQPSSKRPVCYGHITIKVHYLSGPSQQAGTQICLMGGHVDSTSNMARLTNGNLVIENQALRGLGLGSYLFNIIVTWILSFEVDFDIVPVRLFAGDAYPGNLERRNRFYEKFGLQFDYQTGSGSMQTHGLSLPMKASGLVSLAMIPQGLYPHSLDWLAKEFKFILSLPLDNASSQGRNRPPAFDEADPMPGPRFSLIEKLIYCLLLPAIFCLGFSLGKILSHF